MNNAPFGLLITRDDAPAVADPRIVTVSVAGVSDRSVEPDLDTRGVAIR